MTGKKKHLEVLKDLRIQHEAYMSTNQNAKMYEKEDKDIADALDYVISVLEQEPILDKYQAEIDHLHKYIAKLETQITEESFINKSCVSEKTCEHDKNTILDKLIAEIEHQERWLMYAGYNAYNIDMAFSSIKLVLNKYKAESEDKE